MEVSNAHLQTRRVGQNDTLLIDVKFASSVKVNEQYFTFGFISLIANIGGYIGLFIGASFFSLADEILLLFMKCWTCNKTEK